MGTQAPTLLFKNTPIFIIFSLFTVNFQFHKTVPFSFCSGVLDSLDSDGNPIYLRKTLLNKIMNTIFLRQWCSPVQAFKSTQQITERTDIISALACDEQSRANFGSLPAFSGSNKTSNKLCAATNTNLESIHTADRRPCIFDKLSTEKFHSCANAIHPLTPIT